MADHSRLIHDYLDGALDGSREEILFSELSRDPELRREFTEQLALHRAASQDMNSIGIPSAASARLFSELGIGSVPAGTVPAAVAAGSLAGAGILTRFRGIIISSALSIFLGGAGYYYAAQPAAKQAATPAPAVAAVEKKEAAPVVAAPVPEHIPVARNFAVRTERPAPEKIRLPEQEPAEESLAERSIFASLEDGAYRPESEYAEVSRVEKQYSGLRNPLRSNSFAVPVEMPITMQVRGNNSLTDWTATALYEVSPDNFLGFEGGYRSFAQNYDKNINGDVNSFSENNAMPSIGLIYRRMLPQLSVMNITPFAQAGGGYAASATGGWTAGALAGVQYGSAEDRFNVFMGVERTQLWYTIQDSRYSSGSTSFVVGGGIRF